jgi:hypothetical protein
MQVRRTVFHFQGSRQSKLIQGIEGEIASTNPTAYCL